MLYLSKIPNAEETSVERRGFGRLFWKLVCKFSWFESVSYWSLG
jgi:hypothetical protein